MAGTFVSIGNGTQAFARLLNAVKEHASQLPQPVVVQHGHTPFRSDTIDHFDFDDEAGFQRRLIACEVFITHGGGGSVFAAIRANKRPVVVPRLQEFDEIVDNHQVAFARELAKQGKIEPVMDVADLIAGVQRVRAQPRPAAAADDTSSAIEIVARAVCDYARHDGLVLLVTPSGGHLSEIRSLTPCYRNRPHHYVINMPVVQADDMRGRTTIISLSQRDLKFFINIGEAWRIIRRERPAVILTTGGGFSVAFALVGKILRVPTIYVETVAKVMIPTVTGRFMYYLADRFFYQWPQLQRHFPKGRYIGLVL